MFELADFKLKCKSGICYRNTIKSVRCDKDCKQEECYEKYVIQESKKAVKQLESKTKQLNKIVIKAKSDTTKLKLIPLKRKSIKKAIKQDPKWDVVKAELLLRDGTTCRLLKILTESELDIFYSNAPYFLIDIIDPAHIFGKGSHVEFKYDLENLVNLNRFSHTCMDSGLNPITGKMMSPSDKVDWWQRISGIQYFNMKRKVVDEGKY